jgi:hypothetical protein
METVGRACYKNERNPPNGSQKKDRMYVK